LQAEHKKKTQFISNDRGVISLGTQFSSSPSVPVTNSVYRILSRARL